MVSLRSRAGVSFIANLFISTASSLVWPDPKVDVAEFLLYEQQGFNFVQFASFAEVILPPNPTFDAPSGINRAVSTRSPGNEALVSVLFLTLKGHVVARSVS